MALPPGLPDADGDFGDRAVQLAELAGLHLDPWQQIALRAMLRTRADGRWSAYESLILLPRQNGKSVLLEAFDLAKLFLSDPGRNGHLIMHTAHLFPTAMEAFRHLNALIRNTPELWAEVARVSNAHGLEGFELHNGNRLRFAARGVNGAGRGFSPDDVVFDEAFRLPADAEEALTYAVSAKPNPQLVYASSTGFPDSLILWALVERGRSMSDPSLMLAEWSADSSLDLEDPGQVVAAILQANPSMGDRLRLETSMAEYRKAVSQGRLEAWCRERLGWWADMALDAVIDLRKWAALADRDRDPAPMVGRRVLGVDTDPHRGRTAIVAAGARAVGAPMLEVLASGSGVEWAIGRLAEFCGERDVAAVVIDKASAAASLIPALEAAKLPVIGTGAAEMKAACGQFYDAVTESDGLTHLDDPLLTEALKVALKRDLGDAWAWDRKKPTGDITPLVAATLALWGHTSGVGVKKNAGSGRVIALS